VEEYYRSAQACLKKRLDAKLAVTKKKVKADKYGADWELYRDAEKLRREPASFLEAYVKYAQLSKKYPDTMASEAATCYRIKVLLALGDDELNEKARGGLILYAAKRMALHLAAEGLKQIPAPLRDASWTAAIKPMEKQNKELERLMRALVAVPSGAAAVNIALADAEKFIRDNEWGLYRGEVLLDVANYFLMTELAPEKALPYYNRAAHWFLQVQRIDRALNDFVVPGNWLAKLFRPQEKRYKTGWMDIRESGVKAGEWFNRRAVEWYLPYLYEDTGLYRGLIAFAATDYDAANVYWNMIYTLDKEYQAQVYQHGYAALVSYQLMQAVRSTPGSLFLKPKQMQHIKGKKKRLAFYLADLHHENERPLVAQGYYQKLLAGKYGELSREEKAAAIFGVFSSFPWNSKGKEIEFAKLYLADLRGTDSEELVLLGMGNGSGWTGDVKADKLAEAIKYHQLLRTYYPDSDNALNVTFTIGQNYSRWAHLDRSKITEARQYLNEYITLQKEGRQVADAEEKLRELDELAHQPEDE
jgi:hypothetical protein